MEALIRSAEMGQDRRQLRRPAAPEDIAPPPGAAGSAAPGADIGQAARLRQDMERQLADGRRELALERETMRKEMAQQRTEVVAKAEAQGYADGAKRGEAEGRAVLEREAAGLRGAIDDLVHARQSVLDGAEDMLVEIVFAAVARLVGHPAGGREAGLHAIRESARALSTGDALTVLVHPADLEFLKEQVGTMDNVVLRASPVVELGGCMIDGAAGTLDARLETQLERLRQTLVDARALRRQGAQA